MKCRLRSRWPHTSMCMLLLLLLLLLLFARVLSFARPPHQVLLLPHEPLQTRTLPWLILLLLLLPAPQPPAGSARMRRS